MGGIGKGLQNRAPKARTARGVWGMLETKRFGKAISDILWELFVIYTYHELLPTPPQQNDTLATSVEKQQTVFQQELSGKCFTCQRLRVRLLYIMLAFCRAF